MKSNTFFKLFIIIIVGLIFRLWFLDKPEGLWNDEYVSWYIATQHTFENIMSAIFENCHVPLYYFYIKLWLCFFPDTDLSLRYSSVLPSIISIFTIFLCGKELKNKKLGLIAALLTSISSFCIYFAQEVRLYSLVFLITTLIIYFYIKTQKKQSRLNLLLYVMFNAILCATHTIGIIFSVINMTIFFYQLYKKNNNESHIKNFIKSKINYIAPFIITIVLLFPLLASIAYSDSLSQFWSTFNFSKIIFTLTDYFSPIQINIINTVNNLFDYIYAQNELNISYIIFGILPTIIAIYSIYIAYKEKDESLNNLFVSSVLFLLAIIFLSILGKLVLITKYTIEIYPILILITAVGFNNLISSKKYKILVIIYLVLHLSYLTFSNNASPKIQRKEGNRAVIKLIQHARLNKDDIIILTYYDKDKFLRYGKLDYKFNVYSINKFNFNRVMFNRVNYYEILKNGKYKYKDQIIQYPNEKIIEYVDKNITPNLGQNKKVGIIFLNSVSFFTNDNLQKIAQNEKEYKNTSLIFLAFSSIKNSLLYKFRKDYVLDSMTTSGDWSLFVFEKKD